MTSTFHQNLKLIRDSNHSKVISLVSIPAHTNVFEFKGDIIKRTELPKKVDMQNYLQIGKNLFLGPSGDLDDNFQHSCNPNCYVRIVGGRAFLVSLYVIKPDMEITFDYSTTSTDDIEGWQMKCECKTYGCRKIISGFQNLDQTQQEKYKAMKIIPAYVLESIE